MGNVLVVSYTFPPHGEVSVFRVVKFLKYLPHYGWTPSVLTASADAQFEPESHNFRDDLCGVREVRTIGPLGGPVVTHLQHQILGKSSFSFNLLALRWILPAVRIGARLIEKQDINVVYYTAPPFPQLLIAPILKRLTGVPYVIDLRDPWSIHPYTGGGFTNRLRNAFANICEPVVLRNAARICCVTKPMARQYTNAFPSIEDSFETIPNGFDFDEYDNQNSYEGSNGPFTIVYAGKFSSYRDPGPFLIALRDLLNHGRDIQFVHFGRPEDHVVDLVTELGIESAVRFAGYVDRDILVSELSQANLGLVISGGDETELTTKVFDYIGCNRPILAVGQRSGALVDVVSRFENGYICTNQSNAILETLNQLLDHRPDVLGDQQNREAFSRKQLTGRLASVFTAVSSLDVDEYQN